MVAYLHHIRLTLQTAAGSGSGESTKQIYAVDARKAREQLSPFEPQQLTRYLEYANSYRNPRGCAPGVGYFLVLRSDLDDVDFTSREHQADFYTQDSTGNPTLTNLTITAVRCITDTETTSDPNALYLVVMEDVRLYLRVPINKQYLVRHPSIYGSTPSTPAYYEATSSITTYQGIIEDLWAEADSAIIGTLLHTYADYPADDLFENFVFPGMFLSEALQTVLDHINHDLTYNHQSHTFMVNARDTQTLFSLQNSLNRNERIETDELNVPVAVFPETVRVYFPRRSYAFQRSADVLETDGRDFYRNRPLCYRDYKAVDDHGVDTELVTPGTFNIVHSALPAVFDSEGAIQNDADLTSAATKIGTEYYNQISNTITIGSNYGAHVVHRGYRLFIPYGILACVTWFDNGSGPKTEAICDPLPFNPYAPLSRICLHDDHIPRPPVASSLRVDGHAATVSEYRGTPNISRPGIPDERFLVVHLLESIAPYSSGTARVVFGKVSGTTVTWKQSGRHEIVVQNPTNGTLTEGSRYGAQLHTQTHQYVLLGSAPGTIRIAQAELICNLDGDATAKVRNAVDIFTCAEINICEVRNPLGYRSRKGYSLFIIERSLLNPETDQCSDLVWDIFAIAPPPLTRLNMVTSINDSDTCLQYEQQRVWVETKDETRTKTIFNYVADCDSSASDTCSDGEYISSSDSCSASCSDYEDSSASDSSSDTDDVEYPDLDDGDC